MTIATTWHPETGEWSAWPEGNEEEGPYGSGKTEEEAKDDLAYQLDMRDQTRLEAAAPALLEALDFITRCASMNGPHGTTAYLISDAAMTKARAAIAKTKGGTR